MTMQTKLLSLVALTLLLPTLCHAGTQIKVKAMNKLPRARLSQTIELTVKDLAPIGANDPEKIHVRDSPGRELLCQTVDTDYDDYHKPDIVIFQADFAPNETKTFTVTAGEKKKNNTNDLKA